MRTPSAARALPPRNRNEHRLIGLADLGAAFYTPLLFACDRHEEKVTMSVIRVGSTQTYAEGWDAIFGGGTKRAPAPAGKKKSPAATKRKAKSSKAKPTSRGK